MTSSELRLQVVDMHSFYSRTRLIMRSNEVVDSVVIFSDDDEGTVVSWRKTTGETLFYLWVIAKNPISNGVYTFSLLAIIDLLVPRNRKFSIFF